MRPRIEEYVYDFVDPFVKLLRMNTKENKIFEHMFIYSASISWNCQSLDHKIYFKEKIFYRKFQNNGYKEYQQSIGSENSVIVKASVFYISSANYNKKALRLENSC